MKSKNVLVVYKKSAYQIYVLEHKNPLFRERESLKEAGYLKAFRASHELHYQTLRAIQLFFKEKGIKCRAVYRAKKINYAPYDLVITVGGDGTFLEAARRMGKQKVLGINSDPKGSVGSFCTANPRTFKGVLSRFFSGRAKISQLNRLKLILQGKPIGTNVLNDILICHRNPAAMSRYWIKVGGKREEHRSSGLWVSTAAGSTGAIKTAGGRILDRRSKLIQYRPRELYQGHGVKYRLKGGLVAPSKILKIGSMMRDGMLYIDGPHLKIPFRFGDTLQVSNSPFPLSVIR